METLPYRSLGRRAFWSFVIEESSPALITFILFLFLLGTETFAESSIPLQFTQTLPLLIFVLFGLTVLFLLLSLLLSYLFYISFEFVLDENALRIRRGIFNTNETSIPYRQIQDVDLVQSLINKIIGVTRIAILTAGHEDKSGDTDLDFSEATLPAIDYADALVIRESLLSKANVQKVIVS